ncbi:MAG TPA: amino acid adenylation domain-containing protein, partial [Thermoanaerobaculia bacterium]|nr:amino acid adenylation domain-containing protein [Thermoanaerobaculia bacterium]
QQRLWFIDQLAPGSPLYNMPVALRVEGPLDAGVLALCLGEIERRHEALRTVFAARDGAPIQVIRPAASFVLPLVDLSGLPEGWRETEAHALAGQEAGRPFDLARGPLLRGVLLRSGGEEHVLALTMHHIASDGWSMGILVREVTALYAAFSEGRPSPLPELPVQYADFAVWQRSWLHGEILENEISFWRRQLAGLPPLLDLPTDRPRPTVQSYRGTSRPVRLPAALARQAEALARREGATLFMVLLAGFQTVLSRYSGKQDLAVGTPVAGRNRIEIEELIGFFVNTLVLRGDLTGQPTFRELLGRVRETSLAAHTHQDVPFERLVQELAPQRNLGHAPLFQVMFVLQNAPAENLEIRNLRLRPVSGGGSTARFDLTLSLEEHGGGLAGTVTHASDLFDGTTIQRLIASFERLLAEAVAHPRQFVTDLPLLAPEELHQLRIEWAPTVPVGQQSLCAHERFAAQVEKSPDAVALVDGERFITYRDLDRRAHQLACFLRRRGVGPDVLVGLFLERTAELVIAILGILKAGGAYVPLDTTYPKDRLAYMLQDSGARLLITQEFLLPLLPAQTPALLRLDADWREICQAGTSSLESGATPENLAYTLYTSGSTGRAKGVEVTHSNLMSYIDAIGDDLSLPPGSSYIMISTIAADGGNTALFLSLCSGGTLHILSREASIDPQAVSDYLQRHPIDFFKIVVSHFASLFNSPFAAHLLPRKRLILGGEALGWDLVDAIHRFDPDCQVLDHYGPTETTVGVLMNWIERDLGRQRPPMVPPGRPLANADMHILDGNLQEVPAGVVGELYVGGACVARGYLRRPDLTAERFLPNPFGEGRLYQTGDLVRYLPDRKIEFLGRADGQVKIRGFRIEPGEIEAALVALPGVRETVVVVREDRSEGRAGDRRLVAYVAGDAGVD